MLVRKLRLLRLKYGIYQTELARIMGISVQRLNILELNCEKLTPEMTARIQSAFEQVSASRVDQATALQKDFILHRETLCECVEDRDYEL